MRHNTDWILYFLFYIQDHCAKRGGEPHGAHELGSDSGKESELSISPLFPVLNVFESC